MLLFCFLMHWSFFNYKISLFFSGSFLFVSFKAHLVWYSYSHSNILMCVCMIYPFPCFYFQPVHIFESKKFESNQQVSLLKNKALLFYFILFYFYFWLLRWFSTYFQVANFRTIWGLKSGSYIHQQAHVRHTYTQPHFSVYIQQGAKTPNQHSNFFCTLQCTEQWREKTLSWRGSSGLRRWLEPRAPVIISSTRCLFGCTGLGDSCFL